MTDVLYDGLPSSGMWVAGTMVPLFDTRVKAKGFRVSMECRAADYAAPTIGTEGDDDLEGFYLTDEGESSVLLGDLIGFDRVFWEVPEDRWEVSGIEPHEQVFSVPGGPLVLGTVVKPMLVFTHYSYEIISDPSDGDVEPDLAPMKGRFRHGGVWWYYEVGEEAEGDFAKHGDEIITLWKGNIYERARKYVRKADLFPEPSKEGDEEEE